MDDNGQWGFLLDYMMTDIGFSNATAGPTFTELRTSVKTRLVSGYISYKLHESDNARTDLLAGARWYDTETSMTLLPGGGARRFSDNWIDPIIGVRTQFDLSEKWAGTFAADVGGLDDRETWQVLVTANYAFSDNWVGRIGYRHIKVRNDETANTYSFEQSGPVFGVTYRF